MNKLLKTTDFDIVFLDSYAHPEVSSLKEFNEDMRKIETLKRHVKNFFVKKNRITYHKLLNNLILISNIFHEDSYQEVFSYMAYKYFYEGDLFDHFINTIFYFFDVVVDKERIDDCYLKCFDLFQN